MDTGKNGLHTPEQLCAQPVAEEFKECYRALLELSPNPVCVHQGGLIAYANPAALKLAGIQHISDVIGHSIFDFVHPECKPLIEERIRQMQATGQAPPLIEVKCIWPNGTTSDVEIISTPVPWHGEPGVQFILRDITEHRRWEEELRESEAKFHQLADAMPQIVWMASPEGFIDYRNKKFYEQTGLTEEIASNAPCIWPMILHPDDVDPAIRLWDHSMQTGQPFEMQYRYKTSDGSGYRWHLGRALPVRNEKGEILRWFGTCTDIHRQKITELELQKAKEALAGSAKLLEKKVDSRTAKLNASIKSMEDFCYSIAHNLRAPVRAMQGFSTALMEDYGSTMDKAGHDYIERVHRAATVMDALILDLLAYGRIDHQELTLRPVHLRSAIEIIIRHLTPEIEETNAVFRMGDLNYQVVADENMLQHIFINLFSNAIKFAKPGEQALVTVSAEETPDVVRITVQDNGIGIATIHQNRIFHAFERLHSQDEYPGSGIGLAIARKAAERLGGKIGVESEANHGSCFWIELPKTPATK